MVKNEKSSIKKPALKFYASFNSILADSWETFSGSLFTILIVCVLIAGFFSLTGPASTFIQQQAQIHDLQVSVEKSKEAVNDAERIKKQWQDPTFVRAKARERLYFVMPGETQLGVVKDVRIPPDPTEKSSDQLVKKTKPWQDTIITSVVQAGTASPN